MAYCLASYPAIIIADRPGAEKHTCHLKVNSYDEGKESLFVVIDTCAAAKMRSRLGKNAIKEENVVRRHLFSVSAFHS